MKIQLQPEQLYCVSFEDGKALINGEYRDEMPWHLLANCHIYVLEESDLVALLADAASRQYMILNGANSVRRGLRGFSVALGAWGWKGTVECRTLDSWSIEVALDVPRSEAVIKAQADLRRVCRLLNNEATPFRATALKWLGSLYRRLGLPMEPGDGLPAPLPASIAMLCRMAHIGGPIVHAQTSIAPFVSIDRKRAYGEAMLEELPSGKPAEIDLGHRDLSRWTPVALMRALGIAEATVKVKMGPLVPLMPIMRMNQQYYRSSTMYPTGTLRGAWTLNELAYLESSGRGQVEKFHRVVVFEKAKPFAGMIRYLRRLEPQLTAVRMKRLEHMLYGRCARSLSMSRFASSRRDVRPIPSDIVNNRTLERLTSRVHLHRYGLRGYKAPSLPLYELRGVLSEQAQPGTMDRPDRSAWITSHNRIAMCRLIDQLDEKFKVERSGEYIGRIYVDGMDIQATTADLPELPGVSIKQTGESMRIYRAGVYTAELDDSNVVIEDGGLFQGGGGTIKDLEILLEGRPDPDGGPLAGGRRWSHVDGFEDARMVPGLVSEPLHLDLDVVRGLGFSMGPLT
jgi:hypothetical protein